MVVYGVRLPGYYGGAEVYFDGVIDHINLCNPLHVSLNIY